MINFYFGGIDGCIMEGGGWRVADGGWRGRWKMEGGDIWRVEAEDKRGIWGDGESVEIYIILTDRGNCNDIYNFPSIYFVQGGRYIADEGSRSATSNT